jgi:hypothetical protein
VTEPPGLRYRPRTVTNYIYKNDGSWSSLANYNFFLPVCWRYNIVLCLVKDIYMEPAKISVFSTFKFVFWAIFTHFAVYLPIMIGASGVVTGLIYLRQYLETAALISSLYLDILSIVFVYLILASCFWGACVTVAARILYNGHATISVFMQSLKYAPQFICIYAAVKLPSLIMNPIIRTGS